MPDPHGVTLGEAFHVGLGVDIGVNDLPAADVPGTGDLPPVFPAVPVVDEETRDTWAMVGRAIVSDHRLSPQPLAEVGLADTCSCGLPDMLCRIRNLLRAYGLPTS